jgi:hypothetical protein
MRKSKINISKKSKLKKSKSKKSKLKKSKLNKSKLKNQKGGANTVIILNLSIIKHINFIPEGDKKEKYKNHKLIEIKTITPENVLKIKIEQYKILLLIILLFNNINIILYDDNINLNEIINKDIEKYIFNISKKCPQDSKELLYIKYKARLFYFLLYDIIQKNPINPEKIFNIFKQLFYEFDDKPLDKIIKDKIKPIIDSNEAGTDLLIFNAETPIGAGLIQNNKAIINFNQYTYIKGYKDLTQNLKINIKDETITFTIINNNNTDEKTNKLIKTTLDDINKLSLLTNSLSLL